MTEPNTFTREQAEKILCPFLRATCRADGCALFRWSKSICGKTQQPLGQCGLSTEPQA